MCILQFPLQATIGDMRVSFSLSNLRRLAFLWKRREALLLGLSDKTVLLAVRKAQNCYHEVRRLKMRSRHISQTTFNLNARKRELTERAVIVTLATVVRPVSDGSLRDVRGGGSSDGKGNTGEEISKHELYIFNVGKFWIPLFCIFNICCSLFPRKIFRNPFCFFTKILTVVFENLDFPDLSQNIFEKNTKSVYRNSSIKMEHQCKLYLPFKLIKLVIVLFSSINMKPLDSTKPHVDKQTHLKTEKYLKRYVDQNKNCILPGGCK